MSLLANQTHPSRTRISPKGRIKKNIAKGLNRSQKGNDKVMQGNKGRVNIFLEWSHKVIKVVWGVRQRC